MDERKKREIEDWYRQRTKEGWRTKDQWWKAPLMLIGVWGGFVVLLATLGRCGA